MRVTNRECARVAWGIAAAMLGLSAPPTLSLGAARADRTYDAASERSFRAPLPAQAAMRERWRAGAMLP